VKIMSFTRVYMLDGQEPVPNLISRTFDHTAMSFYDFEREHSQRGRTFLAYDMDSEPTGTYRERYAACLAAIREGCGLGGDALDLLTEWAKERGFYTPEPTSVPGPRKPPRTMIVQDWIKTEDPRSLADRAHAATLSLCGKPHY
jgi:hypothetical protein